MGGIKGSKQHRTSGVLVMAARVALKERERADGQEESMQGEDSSANGEKGAQVGQPNDRHGISFQGG
jgi:hypothetical protein